MQRNPNAFQRAARLLAHVLLAAMLLAAARPGWAGKLKLEGQLGGVNTALAVESDKVYVCEGLNFAIYDVKNAEKPSLISRTRLPEQGWAIRVRGGLAYITNEKKLYVYDARAANAPRKLGAYTFKVPLLGMPAYNIWLHDDRVYLTTGDGITVLDVSRPSSPTLVCTLKKLNLTILAVSGGLLLAYDEMATPEPRMNVYSLSDPSTLTLKGSLKAGSFIQDAVISGKTAYLADFESILAVDLSNPARPVIKARYGAEVDGIFDLVGLSGDRLCAIVVDQVPLKKGTRTGAAREGYGGTGAGSAGAGPGYGAGNGGGFGSSGGGYGGSRDDYRLDYQLRVYDVNNPAKPRERGRLALGPAEVNMLAVRGDKAYVLCRDELKIIDFDDDDPRQVKLKGAYRQPLRIMQVRAAGDKAYGLTLERELGVIDLRNPAAPAWRGASSMKTAAPYSLAPAGGRVYIADKEKGLLTYDVTRPDAPKLLGACAPKGFKPVSVAAAGGWVYASDASRDFRIYDLGKPDQPRELSRMLLPTSGSMTMSLELIGVSGGRACLLAYDYLREPPYADDYRLFLVDVANPAAPRLVKTFEIPANLVITSCAFSEGYVYVAARNQLALNQEDLVILDARDPANVRMVSSPALAAIKGLFFIAVSGGKLFASDYDGGFRVYDIRQPEAPRLLGDYHELRFMPLWDIHAQGDYLYTVDYNSGLLVFKYVK